MSELRETVNMVVELRGKGAVLIELQVQRIIAQSESEALQERMAKLDQLIAELEAADAMTLFTRLRMQLSLQPTRLLTQRVLCRSAPSRLPSICGLGSPASSSRRRPQRLPPSSVTQQPTGHGN